MNQFIPEDYRAPDNFPSRNRLYLFKKSDGTLLIYLAKQTKIFNSL